MAGRGQPTRRQLEVLRAYIAAGSIASAAHELGISETTARQHLSGLYRRTGCFHAAQAAYWLGLAAGVPRGLEPVQSSHPESGA
jgi:DNA-binding NarL/FixJ family response regulator